MVSKHKHFLFREETLKDDKIHLIFILEIIHVVPKKYQKGVIFFNNCKISNFLTIAIKLSNGGQFRNIPRK